MAKLSSDLTDDGPVADVEEQAAAVTRMTPESSDDDDEPLMVDRDKSATTRGLEELDSNQLSQDCFSLLFTSSVRSLVFYYAIFAIVFQLAIVNLLLWDILTHFNQDENPFNVPPGVTTQVRITTALALILVPCTIDDFVSAIVYLESGYDKQILLQCRHSTLTKFWIARLSQVVAGASLLFATFVLIMQTDTVLELMLNFTALHFIADINKAAFRLAKTDFVTSEVKQAAIHVLELQMPIHRRATVWVRRGLLVFVWCALMTGYAVLTHQQKQGRFLCQNIYFQVGDGFTPAGSLFSGVYRIADFQINRRAAYTDQHTGQVLLAYCEKDARWTFSLTGAYGVLNSDISLSSIDPCASWVLSSEQTEGFDVTETNVKEWQITLVDGRVEELDFFVMRCYDCEKVESNQGVCSGHGVCKSDHTCECIEGRYGYHCEFKEPCETLEIDQRSSGFSFEGVEFPEKYQLLRKRNGELVLAYGRPAYIGSYVSQNEFVHFGLILFSGRRWIMTSSLFMTALSGRTLPPSQNETFIFELMREEVSQYHGFYHPLFGVFASGPVDEGTPTNAFTPVLVPWYRTRINSEEGLAYVGVDTSQRADASLLCTVCDGDIYNGVIVRNTTCCDEPDQQSANENLCFPMGYCLAGVCQCDDGFGGSLCEAILSEKNDSTVGGNTTSNGDVR